MISSAYCGKHEHQISDHSTYVKPGVVHIPVISTQREAKAGGYLGLFECLATWERWMPFFTEKKIHLKTIRKQRTMPNKFFWFLCVPANTRARQHTHTYTFPTYIIFHNHTCKYMNMRVYINKVIQKTPVRALLAKE